MTQAADWPAAGATDLPRDPHEPAAPADPAARGTSGKAAPAASAAATPSRSDDLWFTASERRAPRTALGGYLRMRWHAWWDHRNPRRDALALSHRNVYILPTRAGWVFALTLGVLLVASINFQLSLGYLLTFLLAGSGVVAMHVTHATLRGLTLHLRAPQPVFAGDTCTVECTAASLDARSRARFGIGLRWRLADQLQPSWTDVPAGGQSTVQIALQTVRRGRQTLPTIVIETRFPLGLFRSWSEWRPAAELLVYPQPERPAPPLPAAQALAGAPIARHALGGETDGVRSYRRGDPLQRVLWKKAARAFEAGGELVSRDTSGSGRQELWLDWADTLTGPGHRLRAADREARLSRLAAWILECERRGVDWGLRLPGTELPPHAGDSHQRAGLTALALWAS